jgi:hypothetical protein
MCVVRTPHYETNSVSRVAYRLQLLMDSFIRALHGMSLSRVFLNAPVDRHRAHITCVFEVLEPRQSLWRPFHGFWMTLVYIHYCRFHM